MKNEIYYYEVSIKKENLQPFILSTQEMINEIKAFNNNINKTTDLSPENKIKVKYVYEEIFNCNLKEITDVKNWMGGLIIKNGIQSKMYHSTLELKPYFENKNGKEKLRVKNTRTLNLPLYTQDGKYFHQRDNHSIDTNLYNICSSYNSDLYKENLIKIIISKLTDEYFLKAIKKESNFNFKGFYIPLDSKDKFDSEIKLSKELLKFQSVEELTNISKETIKEKVSTFVDEVYDNYIKLVLDKTNEMKNNLEEYKKNNPKIEEKEIEEEKPSLNEIKKTTNPNLLF